jgi:hypothetical protein
MAPSSLPLFSSVEFPARPGPCENIYRNKDNEASNAKPFRENRSGSQL